jgi:hypothetical protein
VVNGFGPHDNETFSRCAFQDWKHFLRFHLDRDGPLTIYPIGVGQVAQAWDQQKYGAGPRFLPKEGREGSPSELIEDGPIVIKTAMIGRRV